MISHWKTSVTVSVSYVITTRYILPLNGSPRITQLSVWINPPLDMFGHSGHLVIHLSAQQHMHRPLRPTAIWQPISTVNATKTFRGWCIHLRKCSRIFVLLVYVRNLGDVYCDIMGAWCTQRRVGGTLKVSTIRPWSALATYVVAVQHYRSFWN